MSNILSKTKLSPGATADSALTIATVERDTGLSKDTLRVWERRYGFPQPQRDPYGERIYSLPQVEKLRLIKRLIDLGMRPSKLMGEDTASLLRLLGEHAGSAGGGAEDSEACRGLIELIKAQRHDDLRNALTQSIMKNGLQRFVIDSVSRLNRGIGLAWERGEIEVFEEHLYTEQMQNVLRNAISSHSGAGGHPRVLLTTVPEELHGLGLLMAEALLVPEGCRCVSIGPQTPLPDIAQAAQGGAFDIVALSFSAAFPPRQAVASLAALRQLLPDAIAIWAGGEGMRDKSPPPPGVRAIGHIGEVLDALCEWRTAQAASGSA